MIFKKKHLVGLDIGSSAVKVADVAETKRGARLKKIGKTDIAHGAIEDGIVKRPDEIVDSIRQLFKANKIKEHNVAISIGGYSVIVKKIDVPTMAAAQLQDTIRSEAEQYIPFDINDINLDYQILGENENNPNLMSVLLVAAKKEMIGEYIDIVQMAGLTPRIIDIDAFALQSIFEANYKLQDENIALIDVGNSKTSINIMKDNSSAFMRDVSLGCNQIDKKISSAIGCSIEEAEQIKRGDKTDKISAQDLQEIISSVISEWSSEIQRAFDFFYSTYPDDHINRIVLSGGGANIKEFHHLLSSAMSAEIETINPFKNVYVDDSFDAKHIKQISSQSAICMGLAMRKVDDK